MIKQYEVRAPKSHWGMLIIPIVALAIVLLLRLCQPSDTPPPMPTSTPLPAKVTLVPFTPTPSPTATPTDTPQTTPSSSPTSSPTPTPIPVYTSTPQPTPTRLSPTPTPTPTPNRICQLGRVYTVQTGDWLSKIAQEYYGDWRVYPQIVRCTNRVALTWPGSCFDYIPDPHWIYPDQCLLLPGEWDR